MLVALLTLLAACSSLPFVWVQNYDVPADAPRNGTIVAGDVVEVKVFGQEALTAKETIRTNGMLTMPLVGPVPVAGKPPTVAAAELTQLLAPFVNDPRVTVVIVKSIVSVTAVGEVEKPGVLELEAPATLLQALAEAGGLGKFADRSSIYVVRQQDDRPRRIRFRYDSLTGGSRKATSFYLRTGDIVFVED